VFSVLREPYEPVVFDSLMKPIASEWGARAKSPDLRSEFWRWRRARPLTEFLPMAPAIRAAMVRGFFTASLLGQLDLTETSAAIFVPSESGGPGRMVNFPTPLLAPHPPRSYDYLPVILKSALLAMVDVNTKASLEPMLPYVRLRELGRSGNRGQFEDYDAPAPELEAWVLEGRVAEGAPTPEDPASTVDWEKRRALVEQRFGQLRIRYATDLFAEVDRRKDPFDVPAVYELKADILSALDDLQRVVRHLEPKQQGGWF
jgi:hypothetical protein